MHLGQLYVNPETGEETITQQTITNDPFKPTYMHAVSSNLPTKIKPQSHAAMKILPLVAQRILK